MDETEPLLGSTPEQVYHPRGDNTKINVGSDFAQHDPANPRRWSKAYKRGIIALLAFMSFTVTFTCISAVPVAHDIISDVTPGRHASKQATVLLVTIWELGEAAGPLLIAPLSEVYGRWPVFNVANTIFIIGIAFSALSTRPEMLIFSRFLTGCAVASNVLNPAVVGDLFEPDERGSAMSLIMLAPLLGGAVGPAIAGAIAETLGWRRIMWMGLMLALLAELMFLTLFRETYKPVILRRKSESSSGTPIPEIDEPLLKNQKSAGSESAILTAIARPAKVFWSSAILQAISLQGGLTFSFFYVMSTTFPDILAGTYNFKPALVGTSFLSFSVGSFFGVVTCNFLVDYVYKHLSKKHGAIPENRLPLVVFAAFALPLVVALYGWTADQKWPVALLIVSVVLQGFLCIGALVPVMAYVVDATGDYSASALTAVMIIRCLMGTFLPLAAAPLNDKLGYGLGIMSLAGLCLLMAIFPVLVMQYGRKWRQKSKYTSDQ
ncbi:putative mfs multidrug transporter protein [Teratosphaeria destructans]|uniref:Mfs multidrug transporter protein n=1 Tax=Teratosphaeria destructans TaxID=418781 RepID=A0A9W7SZ21_9PEZI|nr:putative mfs multidrug transporter protein [Teratosphaeria destructans]